MVVSTQNNLMTFTDRREGRALFQYLLDLSDPQQIWPLLPILGFIAPAGGGKSMLIEYLRVNHCYTAGRLMHPYAQLDFTLPGSPKDPLDILIEIRNQLNDNKQLIFPRFDFGTSIALAARSSSENRQLNDNDLSDLAKNADKYLNPLGGFLGALGSNNALFSLLSVGIGQIGQIPQVQHFFHRLENTDGWKWYRDNGLDIDISARSGFHEVYQRLSRVGVPGIPRHPRFIQLLFEAFIDDLRAALNPVQKSGWNRTTKIVCFLDGFEALLEDSSSGATGIAFLKSLALSRQRKAGQNDPLLLVVGSQRHLFRNAPENIPQQDPPWNETKVNTYAQILYNDWQLRLPSLYERETLQLQQLYLPLQLHNFGRIDAREFLHKYDLKHGTHIFDDAMLAQEIISATNGHPLSMVVLSSATRRRHGQNITDLLKETIPNQIDTTDVDSTIGEYLLKLFLGSLSKNEKDDLLICSVPRELDIPILHELQPLLSSHNDAQTRWNQYYRFSFARLFQGKMIFSSAVRIPLQEELPENRYEQAHERMRDYFARQARLTVGKERDQARIEQAYHSLALGDTSIAEEVGCEALRGDTSQWRPLLEAVSYASTKRLPAGIVQRAEYDLHRAQRMSASKTHNTENYVRAIILYTWYLAQPGLDNTAQAHIWQQLGNAHSNLSEGDAQINRDMSITCQQQAQKILTGPVNAGPLGPLSPAATIPKNPSHRSADILRAVFRVFGPVISLIVLLALLISLVRQPVQAMAASWLSPHTPTIARAASPFCETYKPQSDKQGIGITTTAADKAIGISDGRFAFDIARNDSTEKCKATSQFLAGLNNQNDVDMGSSWNQYLQANPNDAEALIYRENQYVLATFKQHHITFVVGTSLTGDEADAGRDLLQGVYVAQKDYNRSHPIPVVLLVANADLNNGTSALAVPLQQNETNGAVIASQILEAMHYDSTIKGVIMGAPLVSYPQVQSILAHVPIVSPSGPTNANNNQSNIFYAAPPIAQEGIDAASYAEQKWHHIAILSDSCDTYSKTLAGAFRAAVQSYDRSTNADMLQADLSYGCTRSQDISSVTRSALNLSPTPDMLYIAGSASDADAALTERRIEQKSVAIMGGDALYKIGGYTNGNFQDFYFTAFAYPDEWIVQNLPQNRFFYEYADDFDGWPPHGTYRFSRPDSDAILAYDAASILLAGNDRAHGGNILDGLRTISGGNAFQSFSGKISFASNGTPEEKAIVVLYVNNGYITYQTVMGRF